MSTDFTRVLIANRGEIAVRVIRAARDEGIETVAVFAEPDRDALHVSLADDAVALGGATAADSYLSSEKVLGAARAAGADAVHPGYGFLSENADFARAVIEAGLVWIGPPPAAIELLGDKVSAREIAHRVGAPLVPGTREPVRDASEVSDFVEAHGLPVAIKAAYGGGGRGIKVVRAREDLVEQYESAVREAIAAFGRGECFVERYLDAPRHVETQCLADTQGNVVVVSTRDCSLQRRNQKLVEEAPAPFLSDVQRRELYRCSKALLREAGYTGAGTCEFLVGADGTISFLEVNTRLQVEHPVSEEVTGIDLVREQFRLARGEALGYGDPHVQGHSFEFRLNGEDPGHDFIPSPGVLERFDLPSGPGVRVDSGFRAGDRVSGAFDSLLAKLIVTGATRAQALERARRALAEMRVEGVPTVLDFHRKVVTEPAFASAFAVHTRWIETEFSAPSEPAPGRTVPMGEEVSAVSGIALRVHGREVSVDLPGRYPSASIERVRAAEVFSGRTDDEDPEIHRAPMAGSVVSIAVSEGQAVESGDLLLVVESMKMERPILAERSGRVDDISVDLHDSVSARQALLRVRAEETS